MSSERLPEHPDYATYLSGADQEEVNTEHPSAPGRGHEYTRMAVAAGDTFRAEDVKDLLSHLDIAAERASRAEARLKRVRELFEDHRHLLPGDLCAALDGVIYPGPGPARVDLQARFEAEVARGAERAAFYARHERPSTAEGAER